MNPKSIARNRIQKLSEQGFTLVEVLIAGVLLTAVLTAVARFSTQAMAGSNHQKERQALEASINDNVQLIQQADSQITKNRLENESDGFFDDTSLSEACGDGSSSSNAASFLMAQILNGSISVAAPESTQESAKYSLQRTLTVINQSNTYMLRVEYRFDGPEEDVGSEYRVIEVSPSFEAGCYQ